MRHSNRSHRATAALAAALAILLTASAAIAASPQQQRPLFQTRVEIVQLQVAIAGSDGIHVPYLEPDDFVLRVNDEIRDVVALYEVDLSQPFDPEADDTYVPPAGWRQFLLFFDFTFSTKSGVLRAQDAARTFVREHLHPRDLVGVAKYTSVGGLELVSPFTADRGQVLRALDTFGLSQGQHIVGPGGFAVDVVQTAFDEESSRTIDNDNDGETDTRNLQQQTILDELFSASFLTQANDFRRYREQVINYADRLVGLGELLRATNGRKHVMLFSAGFSDEVLTGQSLDELSEDASRINLQGALGLAAVNSETRFGSVDLRNSLQEAVANFRHADVVFHAFDVGGLGNEARDDTFATTTSGKQALSYLADGTNGTVHWNMNNLEPSLELVAEQTSRYYVIAYRKQPTDPDIVELDIEIQRPGARVVAAPTRFSPPPAYGDMDDAQRQLQLAEFIAKGVEEEDMIFDVRAVPFSGAGAVNRVAVVMEVPFEQLRAIAGDRGDGHVELDLLGYVLDERDEMRDLFSRRVRLNVDRVGEQMPGMPLRYYDLLWAVPGDHRVRVLVRDAQVGRLSTRTVEVRVPDFGRPEGILVSGPIAIDAEHPGLLMRGIDPDAVEERRQGGPVAYPFTLADQEITPQVYTISRPGGSCQFMMVSYNVTRHPFTGETQTMLDARAVDEFGNVHALGGMTLIGRHYDEASDATTLLVQAQLPETLLPGAYLLEIDLIDAIGGQTVQQVLPLLISGAVTASE